MPTSIKDVTEAEKAAEVAEDKCFDAVAAATAARTRAKRLRQKYDEEMVEEWDLYYSRRARWNRDRVTLPVGGESSKSSGTSSQPSGTSSKPSRAGTSSQSSSAKKSKK